MLVIYIEGHQVSTLNFKRYLNLGKIIVYKSIENDLSQVSSFKNSCDQIKSIFEYSLVFFDVSNFFKIYEFFLVLNTN